MDRYRRTILGMAVVLALSMLACGQDVKPARQPTSTPGGARAASAAVPAAEATQTTTNDRQSPRTDEPQSEVPVYEGTGIWGEDLSDGVSFASPN